MRSRCSDLWRYVNYSVKETYYFYGTIQIAFNLLAQEQLEKLEIIVKMQLVDSNRMDLTLLEIKKLKLASEQLVKAKW